MPVDDLLLEHSCRDIMGGRDSPLPYIARECGDRVANGRAQCMDVLANHMIVVAVTPAMVSMKPDDASEGLIGLLECALSAAVPHGVTNPSWGDIPTWFTNGYAAAPALILGMAALLVIPALALYARIARDAGPSSDRTRLIRALPGTNASVSPDAAAAEACDRTAMWPGTAWIEVDGTHRGVIREMVRLGREDDNDVVFPDRTVHRYHAVIHRGDVAGYRITDLSSAGGNGIVLNGQRVSDAALADGDTVQLGAAVLTFREAPA